jgi:hypothetical protein
MKKQLLNEKQIRKMMKFANIGALSDGFITKLTENEMMEGDGSEEKPPMEEELEEGYDEFNEALNEMEALEEMGDHDPDMPPMEEGDTLQEVRRVLRQVLREQDEMGMEMGGDEMDMDMGGEEEEGMEDEEEDALCSAMTALKALKKGLEELDPEAAAKIQIETEEEGEDMEVGGEEEGGDMPDLDMEMGGEEEEGGDMPPGLQESRRRQRKVVSEVTRRVARRLMRLNNRKRR